VDQQNPAPCIDQQTLHRPTLCLAFEPGLNASIPGIWVSPLKRRRPPGSAVCLQVLFYILDEEMAGAKPRIGWPHWQMA
jgi:hypothetical protein